MKKRKQTKLGHPTIKGATLIVIYIERSNLTMRTLMRRFTRLALGFSKKLDNLKSAVALYFTYYNFCWIPRTTRVTPAMGAGIVSSPWTMKDLFEEISN